MNAFDVAGLCYLQLQMLLTAESSEMQTDHICTETDTWVQLSNNLPTLNVGFV